MDVIQDDLSGATRKTLNKSMLLPIIDGKRMSNSQSKTIIKEIEKPKQSKQKSNRKELKLMKQDIGKEFENHFEDKFNGRGHSKMMPHDSKLKIK